jgi:hypothetical protein
MGYCYLPPLSLVQIQLQSANASLGKQKRRIKSTTTTVIGKRTAAIDFYRRIDPGTRLPARLDCRRRVGTSAKRKTDRTQKSTQLSGFAKSLGEDKRNYKTTQQPRQQVTYGHWHLISSIELTTD